MENPNWAATQGLSSPNLLQDKLSLLTLLRLSFNSVGWGFMFTGLLKVLPDSRVLVEVPGLLLLWNITVEDSLSVCMKPTHAPTCDNADARTFAAKNVIRSLGLLH